MKDSAFRRRSKLLRTGLFIAMLALIMRLLYIQVAQANDLSDMAQDWIKTERELKGVRGTVYDRHGERKLAFTGIAYDISVDLGFFRADNAKAKGDTPEEYARFLATLVDLSYDEIYPKIDPAKFSDKQRGVYIGPKGQKVSSDIKDKIDAAHKDKKFLGITAIPVDVRRYPNGQFAAHVLGYFGENWQTKKTEGLGGVEATYNDVLTGKPGWVEYYTDRFGGPIPTYEPEVKVPAVDGQDIVLTIDSMIQHFVEDELDRIVQNYAPKHASIIVADPRNGEILALGNRPAYNPNTFAETTPADALWDNWALQAFEPGSTFKAFVLAAALAEHKINLSDTFQSGSISIDGRTVSDWNKTGWGTITYRQGVYNSSNVGFVKIGQKLGKTMMFDYLSRFGFDRKTGIDLPNESLGFMFDPEKMRDIDLASTSFGQGISVTPIQQVASLMAIANGGKIYQPHVVKEFRDQKTGETLGEVQPKVLYEVANEETMSTVREVLEETVTADGKGYIKGYHVAGKTGTAQVSKDGRYEDNLYRLSFMGFAPANNPRLLIYVTVDQPSKNVPFQFGSYVAEPSAKIVLEHSLRYLQVPIDDADPGIEKDPNGQTVAKKPEKPKEPTEFVAVPDFIGSTAEQAQGLSEKSRLKIDSVGDGAKVTGQWPAASYGQVPAGTEIKLYFGPEGSKEGKVKMPDLRGLSLREAMETLSLLQLGFEPSGTGFVTKQEVPPGTLVPSGTTVKLELAPQS